jgi:hypothetical protein
MPLKPGKYYPGSPIRLTVTFADTDGNGVDPTTVLFKTQDPLGTNATYTYGTDAIVGRSGTGLYYADFTPDQGGRWFIRWETTGTTTTFAIEDSILIQRSPFLDGREPDAYRRPW